jgi:hypothetical protein
MSGHYADRLKAIFDEDQIVEGTIGAIKPDLLDTDQNERL